MACSFNKISAKPTFRTIRNNLTQKDYINRKYGKRIFCSSNKTQCNQLQTAKNYNQINSFNLGKHSIGLEQCRFVPINKNDLIIGQYTTIDLNNVCIISQIDPNVQPTPCSSDNPCNPCQITGSVIIDPSSATTPFYYSYQIDPLGQS